ncbi:MAG: translation initiation factor IF-3 [Patescibacteria group bacterium]|nr:translation initiation factor IF-3 [Patescibacteria group bacterium]MBU2509633.1 translation initiation factor IF-3 [Patescibacteria group bacterium]
MRIHYRRRTRSKDIAPRYRANEQIRIPEIRVIDEDDNSLGVMKTADALALAKEREYDLVEVSPKADPPVCRFLDLGAFKYQKEKELRQQKARAKKIETKGIRLSVKMGEHDLEVRKQKALDFLKAGQKLKIEIILRGREKAHGELAIQRIKGFIEDLGKSYELLIEQEVKRQRGNVSATVGRKS